MKNMYLYHFKKRYSYRRTFSNSYTASVNTILNFYFIAEAFEIQTYIDHKLMMIDCYKVP